MSTGMVCHGLIAARVLAHEVDQRAVLRQVLRVVDPEPGCDERRPRRTLSQHEIESHGAGLRAAEEDRREALFQRLIGIQHGLGVDDLPPDRRAELGPPVEDRIGRVGRIPLLNPIIEVGDRCVQRFDFARKALDLLARDPRHGLLAADEDGGRWEAADLLADGSLRVPIQQTYSLATALDALHALSAEHTQGKLVIGI